MHPFVLDGMTVESQPNSVSYINTDTRDMPWSLPVVRGILYTDFPPCNITAHRSFFDVL